MQVLATATKTKGIKRNIFTAAERIRQRTSKVGLEEGDVHVQLLIIFMKGTGVREKIKSRTCLCCGAGFPNGQPFSNSSHSKIPYEKMSHCVGKKSTVASKLGELLTHKHQIVLVQDIQE